MIDGSRAQPLRQPQVGIWFSQLVRPEDDSYFTLEVLEIRGALSKDKLKQAWESLIRSLPHLNVHIEAQAGALIQLPEPELPSIEECPLLVPGGLQTLELWASSEPRPALGWKLLRAALVEEGPHHHWLGLRIHHVLIDGYGYELLFRQWGRLYDDPGTRSPFLTDCHAALAHEELAYQSSAERERDSELLRALCAGRAAQRRPENARPPATRPRAVACALPWGGLAPLKAEARQAGLEWLALLIATVSRGVQKHFTQSPLTVGLIVAGRMGSVGAATPSMAMNVVPLSVALAEGSPSSALAEQLKVVRRAQRLRHEELRRGLGCRPFESLFDFVVNVQFLGPQVGFSGLSIRRHSVWKGPVEDLMVSLTESPGGAELRLEGHPELYSEAELLLLLGRCEALLLREGEPPEPAGSTFAERPLAKQRWSAPATVGSLAPCPQAQSILETWLALVRANTAAPCVEDGTKIWSRGDLLEAVQTWAAWLTEQGVTAGGFVVIDLPRSADFVAVELAALWIGAAFVPLDSQGPLARKELICAQLPKAIRVTEALAHEREERIRAGTLAARMAPARTSSSAAAYVVFTSGTTGSPRGVVVERGNLDHFVHVAAALYGFSQHDRVLQFASLGFDASIEEVFCSLVSGATLVLRSERWLDSSASFWALTREHGITVLDLPTAFFHTLAEDLEGLSCIPKLRTVIVGGEALKGAQLKRFQAAAPRVTVWNTYGPTETTVVCLAWQVPPRTAETDPPLGRPLPGIALTIEAHDTEHPEEGELIVWGPTVARGYLSDPMVGEARFIDGAPPEFGARARGYRTGDRVALRADGQLAYLGRVDSELKISGYRVQPLEIERTLASLPQVSEAAVLPDSEGSALLAFVRAEGWTERELKAALESRYPRPLVPSVFLQARGLPRDAHGKVHRQALLDLAAERRAVALATYPASRLPPQMARLAAEVLGAIPLDAHFFDAGGTSLLALRLHSKLTQEFGNGAPLSQLFRAGSIAEFLESWLGPSEPPPKQNGAAGSPFRGDLLPLDHHATGDALVCLPSADGMAASYWGIPEAFPEYRNFALNALHDDGTGADDLFVRHATESIGAMLPERQVSLLGWSSGGGLALAVAASLLETGWRVREVLLLDALAPECFAAFPEPSLETSLVMLLDGADASPTKADGSPKTIDELLDELGAPGSTMAHHPRETLLEMAASVRNGMQRYRRMVIPPLDAPVTLYRSTLSLPSQPADNGWSRIVPQMKVVPFPFHHLQMCSPAALRELRRLRALEAPLGSRSAQNSRSI